MALSDEDQRKLILERREFHRAKLSGLYVPYYDMLCEGLDQTGELFWCPSSSLRELSKQADLYAQGRTKSGPIVTDAPPGASAHNWGCATDWAWFAPGLVEQEIYDQANWSSYKQVIEGISQLAWGGDFIHLPDKPHNELALTVSWGQVGRVYGAQGEEAAWRFIQNNLKVNP